MMSLLQKAETLKLIEKIKSTSLPVQLQDVYQWIENYSPTAAKGLLSLLLPWVRPFTRGRWFRVSRINDEEIEIIVPFEVGNKDSQGGIHEAVLFGAALEASKLFWWRHIQIDPQVRIHDAKFKFLKRGYGDLRLRAQIPEKTRELVLFGMRTRKIAQVDLLFKVFDQNENLVTEIEIESEISLTPQLGHS